MKKIILSADDFGKSHERNLAVDYAMKHGLIKAAALIMGSKFTDEAIDFAREGGVHGKRTLSYEFDNR